MAGRRNYVTMSNFVCTECEMEMRLPRLHGNQRKKRHIKDIYCPKCKEVRKFVEYRYKECYKTIDGEVIG